MLLLSQLCVCLAREPSLLEFFLQPPPEPGAAPRLLLFSRLVPFVHREGTLGQQARDALLLLMALSAGSPTVGRYIADHSYFCPVSTSWDGCRVWCRHLPVKEVWRGYAPGPSPLASSPLGLNATPGIGVGMKLGLMWIRQV